VAVDGPSGRGPPLTGALNVGPGEAVGSVLSDAPSEVVGTEGTWADPEKCPESGAADTGAVRGGMFGQA
jgi:hypothetical protein